MSDLATRLKPVEPTVDTATGQDAPARESSATGRLRARRKAREKRTRIRLPVPSWDGDLVAEFKVVDADEIEAEVFVDRNADLIAKACVGVYGLTEDGSGYVLLDSVFGHKLAEHLEMPFPGTVRAFIRDVCEGPVAVNVLGNTLIGWMADTSQRIEGEIDPGKLRPATST